MICQETLTFEALVSDEGAATQIWIAAGVTDMRRGLPGLAAQVQTVLKEKPYSGHVFAFRGRRGDTVKLLRFDGRFHQPYDAKIGLIC